jgi:epoxyqueuosine reductase
VIARLEPGAAPASPRASLEARLKAQAYGLGFDLAGIARLGEVGTASAFERWLAAGYAGEMGYLPRGAEKRRDTRRPYEGAVSAIVVAMSYGGREPSGPVARYARGDDYHDVMVERLRALHARLDERLGRPVRGKAYVDTGPILERDLARRAGLGWFGKSTMLVNPRIGSFFFLGALLVEAELEPDEPFEADRCGTCRRCIDACPTGAIVDERVLDATRCISYLTIEQRGEIPAELREGIGGMVYGCDICQDVCPWNVSFAAELPDDSPYVAREALAGKDVRTLARDLLVMTQEEFSRAFSKSPMKRAKLRGLRRNAAVVLGNVGTADDVGVLARALDDEEPLVREHAAWALRRLGATSHGPPVAAEARGDARQGDAASACAGAE